MPLKIEVSRLFSPEEIAKRITAEKEAHEKLVAKRKELCASLGLDSQVRMCEYKPQPENFYSLLTDPEFNTLQKFSKKRWWSGKGEGSIEEFGYQVPDGVLEEISFFKTHNIFFEWEINQLKDDLGFWILGKPTRQKNFLVVRWGDSDKMKSFAQMEHMIRENEETAKRKREEELRAVYAQYVNAKVALTPVMEKFAMDRIRTDGIHGIKVTIDKAIFNYHCARRMYKVRTKNCYDKDLVFLVCGLCGVSA